MKKECVDKFIDDIKSKNGLAYYNASKTEIVTLCPKCEKERFFTQRNHGHLYIGIENPVFNCFRCNFKGFINKFLFEMGLNIEDYFDNIEFKKDWKNIDADRWIESDSNFKYKIPLIDIENFNDKYKYLISRLHFNSNEFINNHKDDLIFDIKKFIEYNNINFENEGLLNYLQSNFIGFLTTMGSFIICRNIDERSDFKHYKINLNKNIYFKDFYGKKLNDIKYDEINDIILTEGIFDLLNAVENKKINHIIKKSCYIATALNNQYDKTLISCLNYNKLTFSNVHILSDSNITENDYRYIRWNPSVNNLIIYWNKLDKDFGSKNVDIVEKIVYNKIRKNNGYNNEKNKQKK